MSTDTADSVVTTTLAEDDQIKALVKAGMAEVVKGKTSLPDLIQRVISPRDPAVPDKTPPVPMKLSDDVKAALAKIPEVFGKTVVTADRKLTHAEVKALVEESDIISKVLTVLKKRKEESIREVLANHADHLIPEDEQDSMRRDAKGHLAPWDTQNIPVEGTDLKIQRFASGGKPVTKLEHIEALLEEGLITRAEYLSMTRKPDAPRVLDEDGLHKAIQKNPRLFFLIASRAEATLPTTTVKVAKNT